MKRDRLVALLLSQRARPLRFVFTGGLCGLIQLLLFLLLTRVGWQPLLANIVAFLFSAQVNFLLSISFTWSDRVQTERKGWLARWLAFHSSILGTALLNQLVFFLAHLLIANQFAAIAGIGVAALANFVLLDRRVFRYRQKIRN
jgi:putative flippase GtrA